jgi:hypothetical protein
MDAGGPFDIKFLSGQWQVDSKITLFSCLFLFVNIFVQFIIEKSFVNKVTQIKSQQKKIELNFK